GKFGHFGLNFGVNNVFTFDSYGIYEAMVTGEVINTSSWQTIIRKNGKGFANCIKLSNKNIWAVGNYIYPYHFNGADWQEIDIYSGNEPITGNDIWGIWGNEKEIFICDTENGIIYHGKSQIGIIIMKTFFSILSIMMVAYNLSYSQYDYSDCTNDNNPCPRTPSGNFNISGQAWAKSLLKYYFVNGTSDIEGDIEKTAFEYAFQTWSAVVPFEFIEVYNSNEADI